MSKKLIWILGVVMTGTMVWMIFIQTSWFRTSFELRQGQFSEQVTRSLNGVVTTLEEREVVMHITREVTALSFDSIPAFDGKLVSRPGHELVDETLRDKSKNSSTMVVVNKDSIVYTITDSTRGRYLYDQPSMKPDQFRDEVSRRVHHDKSVFVENLVNQLIRKKVNLEDRVDPQDIQKLLREQLRLNGIYSNYEFAILDQQGQLFFRTPDYGPSDEVNLYEATLFPNDLLSPPSSLAVYFPDEAKISLKSLSKNMITSIILAVIIMSIFVVTLLIITKQKKLHEMKTDFVNNMTHELKTPISSISLASQMLKDPSVSINQESVSRMASVIEDESKRLGFQVERVLQMAQLDRGKTILKLKELTLNDIVKKVVRSFELKVKNRDGVLLCKYGAKDDMIEGDEVHITNLIHNLLDNALKYCDKTPDLRITTRNVNKGVEMVVADNGIGISRDDQKRVFDNFFRVHTGNVHDVKGFGIGLSYVKKIVDAHHGRISLKSEIGKGSTFTIFIPFNQ